MSFEIPLANIIHDTADRMYENILDLQSECTKAADIDRKRKLLEFCLVQRHRALQMLSLLEFAEEESSIVSQAKNGVEKEAMRRISKNDAAWNPFSAAPIMQQYSAFESAKVFNLSRAPRYDVASAVNSLINGKFQGFPKHVTSLFETTDDELVNTKKVSRDLIHEQVISRLLAKEYIFNQKLQVNDGELICEEDGSYLVKLSLEKDSDQQRWYPTCFKFFVKSRENPEDCVITLKWARIIGDQLEQFIAKNSSQSVVISVSTFMRTFCASLAFQILEKQAENLKLEYKRTPSSLKVGLKIKRWSVLIKMNKLGEGLRKRKRRDGQEAEQEKILVCRLICIGNEQEEHVPSKELDGSQVTSLSLNSLLNSAFSETTRYQLEYVRSLILKYDSRHHKSQTKVYQPQNSEEEHYILELRLFQENSVLTVKLNLEGVFELKTNSKASRWGHYSAQDYLLHKSKQLETISNEKEIGQTIAQVWNEAEAWDCLSCAEVVGLTSEKAAFLPPDLEIAHHSTRGSPSLYWSLGCFEGLRYVFVVQYVPPASSFHMSFHSLKERLSLCTSCSVVSVEVGGGSKRDGATGYRKEPAEFSSLSQLSDVYEIVRTQRKKWVADKLVMLGLNSFIEDEWEGGNSEAFQEYQPFRLQFLQEGEDSAVSLKVFFQDTSFACKKTEAFDVVFERNLHNRRLLKRLSQRPAPSDTTLEAQGPFCLFKWDNNRSCARMMESLKVLCVPAAHPLEVLIAQYWDIDSSNEAFDDGLRLFIDSTRVIQAAAGYAQRHGRLFRVSASRLTFDCRFTGNGGATTWNRFGWDGLQNKMMTKQVETVAEVIEVLNE